MENHCQREWKSGKGVRIVPEINCQKEFENGQCVQIVPEKLLQERREGWPGGPNSTWKVTRVSKLYLENYCQREGQGDQGEEVTEQNDDLRTTTGTKQVATSKYLFVLVFMEVLYLDDFI